MAGTAERSADRAVDETQVPLRRPTDTAERPAVAGARRTPPPPPPELPEAPSRARFPLYADELPPDARPPGDEAPVAVGTHPAPAPTATAAGPAGPEGPSVVLPPPPPTPPERGETVPVVVPGWWWLVLAGVLLVAALVGAWLALRGNDAPATGTDTSAAAGASAGSDASEPTPTVFTGRPSELAGEATFSVPATAPPNQDVSGKPTDYEAANMADGDPTTAWRMPGDGTGESISIDLGAPREITRVGLVNGYAKQVRDGQGHRVDWYVRNRRVARVAWVFDDGTSVTQRLRMRPRMQTMSLDEPVVSRSVELRLVEVTPPKAGRLGRNFTAISELSIVGRTG